ncbi:MAG TPA: hypothetical protein VG889_18240 [Rhizomicrobium sp.]|nr:hypothetical protein [Rhizomicrobium sp.]
MPRRFTGIQLLLAFVAVNTVMFLMLVTSMTSETPWLARVLPGQFGAGVNSSGYWVFFALVLLVNALTVLIAGLVLVLPALRDGAHTDEKRLARHLADRAGLSDDSKDAVLAALREDVLSAQYQLMVGRLILAAGMIFLVLAFAGVSLSFARALPDGQMFRPATNAQIAMDDVEGFTADQIAGAVLLDAPEIYDWHLSALSNNPANPLFTNFVFAFRTVLGLMTLLLIGSFVRRSAPGAKKAKPQPAPASTSPG